MSLRGVNIGPWDVFQNTLTQQDFLNLGIEYVKINCHLGNLVQDDGQGGWEWKTSYKSGEVVLDTWTRYVQWASDAGLKVTPDISLSSEGASSWLNQTTFWDPINYPNFASLWGTLAELFDGIPGVVSLHILHVPGHKGTGNESDWMNVITPTTIEAIRAKSNKKISWMPFLFGWGDVDGVKNHTGWYATGQPLPYPNIEYGFNHYANVISNGLTNLVSHRCEPYDEDIAPLLWHLQPAIDFKNKFNVPMGCWEFGLDVDGCGGWPLQEPSRLLWLRDMLTLFRQNNFDWAYWNLAVPEGYGGTAFSIMNYDHTFRTELVNLLVDAPISTVTISVEGSGTTEPAPGTYSIEEGNLLEVAAYPDEGWEFAYWILNGFSYTENPIQTTVLEAIDLKAVFNEKGTPPPSPPPPGPTPLLPRLRGFLVPYAPNLFKRIDDFRTRRG